MSNTIGSPLIVRLRPVRRRASRAALLLVSAAGLGCPEPSARAPVRRLENLGPPALHAVQSEELRQLMGELRASVFEEFPTELELDRKRAARAAELASTASALATAADRLVAAAPSFDLGEAERRVFADLAGKLGQQAREIEDLARQNRIQEISAALDRTVATCNACHTSFRVFPPTRDGAAAGEAKGVRP